MLGAEHKSVKRSFISFWLSCSKSMIQSNVQESCTLLTISNRNRHERNGKHMTNKPSLTIEATACIEGNMPFSYFICVL